jgi:uncharacterized protein YbjT (DUF2867 family)
MQIAIAGAHGQIALLLARRLIDRDETVVGLVRNPEQVADLEERGIQPVVCDLEHAAVDQIADAITGADAVVFAAGAGPGSGSERKWTMDRNGAVKLLQAATAAGVTRYLIISSIGAEAPPAGDDTFSVYLRAKAEADAAVRASDRQWTIVRPGRLTNAPGSGRVRIQADAFRGEIPRDDVAAVLDALIGDPRTPGKVLYVNRGDDPIEAALDNALT